MKRQSAKKLQLKKDVIAQLNKAELSRMNGAGGRPTNSLVPQLCYQDYTARSCGVNCPTAAALCNSNKICNDGQIQTVDVSCHI